MTGIQAPSSVPRFHAGRIEANEYCLGTGGTFPAYISVYKETFFVFFSGWLRRRCWLGRAMLPRTLWQYILPFDFPLSPRASWNDLARRSPYKSPSPPPPSPFPPSHRPNGFCSTHQLFLIFFPDYAWACGFVLYFEAEHIELNDDSQSMRKSCALFSENVNEKVLVIVL